VRRDRDRDAVKIRQMRDDGQRYQEIADELAAAVPTLDASAPRSTAHLLV
jgi:hypothetical protein